MVVTLYAGELNDGNQSTGWSPGDEVSVRRFTERERERELFAYCGCGPAVSTSHLALTIAEIALSSDKL